MAINIKVMESATVDIIELCRKWTGIQGNIVAVHIEASVDSVPVFTLKVQPREPQSDDEGKPQ